MANKLFNSVKVEAPSQNNFDLTHDVKLTMQMGNLVPILAMDCVPGDNVKLSFESLVKFQPMLAPPMQRMDVYIHSFFVPYRIIWPNWEKWIVDAGTSIVAPYISAAAWSGWETLGYNKLLDYMGVPPIPATGTFNLPISMFNFAAYQCIYNEYYRDQNLVPEVDYKLVDGDNSANVAELLKLRKRAWEHDYFTAALPFAQKGAAVDIPLGTIDQNVLVKTNTAGGTTLTGTTNQTIQDGTAFTPFPNTLFAATEGIELEPTTINDLRRAFKLQEWLEKNARGGTRYIESNKVHFDVNSPDARLQRPEYITGSKSPVVISEILNTTGIDGELPQGNMSGHGMSLTGSNQGSYYATEHGVIIGIMSILPKPSYSQGVPKQYLRSSPLDFYWPSFANIGEQEIKQEELYAYDAATQGNTFGYIPRYAEYKYIPNRIAGDFRTTLDFWTLSRQFATSPTLSQQFIECDPDETTRIFAVQDGTDPILVQVLNKINARRKMPVYGTPSF